MLIIGDDLKTLVNMTDFEAPEGMTNWRTATKKLLPRSERNLKTLCGVACKKTTDFDQFFDPYLQETKAPSILIWTHELIIYPKIKFGFDRYCTDKVVLDFVPRYPIDFIKDLDYE